MEKNTGNSVAVNPVAMKNHRSQSSRTITMEKTPGKCVHAIVLNTFEFDSRVLKTNKSLVKEGYDVSILAMHTRGLEKKENIGGIKLFRIGCLINKWQGNIFKIIIVVFIFVLRASVISKKCDIIHCNDLQALPVGFLVKLLFNRKVKIVYDAHEYEIEKQGLNSVLKQFVRIAEKLLIRYADSVITVSDEIAEEYQQLYGIPKPTVVLNCPNYSEVQKSAYFREKFNIRQDQIILLYQGALSKGRGIDKVLEAFKQTTASHLALIFLGYGPLLDSLIHASNKFSNIFVHEAVPSEDLLRLTSSADIGLSLIENRCLSYYYSLPNKMFEYLMADLPIIVSNLYSMRKFVDEYRVGISVDEKNSIEELKSVFENITFEKLAQMKVNFEIAKNEFNWEIQEEHLLRVYRKLAV